MAATSSQILASGSQAGMSAPPSSNNSTTEEYVVRVPGDNKKKYSMIKFSTGTELDFLKYTQSSVKMERENNLKEYKSVYDIDTMPKFGAGSEYGREQKEEARRKKYGINIKQYNPEDQPWIMKAGSGKQARRFRGVREGTITENTAYYIFTKCADRVFEAFPIEEWYNFHPMIRYKYLNSEEAEDEYKKRDRTMNYFSIMVRRQVKNEKESEGMDDEEEKKAKSKAKAKSKKGSSLQLTDMDDWMSSGDEDDEEDADDEDDKGAKPKQEKKKTSKGKKSVKNRNSKHNSDDEAIEESDEGDFDDRELDYITDSGESDSDVEDKDEKEDKYDDKGVDQETGLKKLIDSDESSEDEETKKEEENVEEKSEKKSKKDGEESDSSSSSSGSESDIEKEEGITSALFMQKKERGSRPGTPNTGDGSDKTGLKRKLDDEEASAKKIRTESPSIAGSSSSGEITEQTIRRYLMRKPMTAKELVQKFKSKKPQMTKEQMTHKIGQLLKKINPHRTYVNNILYLSVKKTG